MLTRNDVHVGMRDGLPSSEAIIEADVEAIRRLEAGEQPLADLGHQFPDRLLLGHGQLVGGADVLAGQHQHMAIGYREGIRHRDGVLALDPDALRSDVAEWASSQTGRIASSCCRRWQQI